MRVSCGIVPVGAQRWVNARSWGVNIVAWEEPLDDEISEDERTELARVAEALETAQKAYDDLEHLRTKRLHIARPQRRRRTRRFEFVLPGLAPPPATLHDYPRPAARLLSDDEKRRAPEVVEIAPARALETYRCLNSLDGTSACLGVGRKTTIRLLKEAGVDLFEDIACEWDRGIPLRELSRCHGPPPQTISHWIKKTGRTVAPRNANRRYDEAEIIRIYDECQSANAPARQLGLSWSTVRKVLVRNGKWSKRHS
jgi:hypothetical protein